ncbi:amino acid adenylation domain-containing protein [Longimicrobium sp.]|uniref:non-ribosomal peptide synthetase n=1 Tax=Longimicrobium sp. TaxID=2029185 RepID=UPI003B3A7BE6
MTELADRLAKLTPAQRKLLELRRAQQSGAAPAAIPARGAGPAPLSFAQERLWFLDRMEPGNAFYNLPNAVRMGGALDHAALERALGEIVRRHEALRTVFAEADGAPVQVIASFGGFVLPVEDLSGLGEADREAAARQRIQEEAARPFDLSAGPLFRAALLRLGETDHVLLLSMHHIVSDGWSLGVLLREMWALYEAFREGRASPLSALPVQYADYAAWQREQLAGEALDRQLAYWRERLSGAPELLELPADHPRPAVQTYRGATVPVELSAELLERLQALGRGEGATLYMTLLAGFQVLLSRYSGSDDVVVGSPIAGRTRKEVEELIGLFVNTLVLRTDLSGDPSFRETLRRVREATLGAYAHQDVPFEKLVAELQPERTLSHTPLFQVMFQLDKAGGGGGALPGLSARGASAEQASAQFDLSLELTTTPRGLRGVLIYSTDLFDRGTAERMVGHLARVLEQVAADPDVRLSRVALAGPRERAQVVVEWNRTERPFPREASIHQLFQEQVRRTPEAAALVWGAEELTYRELDARANRLAHHLAGLGVGPESRVGLRVERSVANVVATLGVLKAGGCCVPVDTSYPAERMELMLADSGVRVLLSDGELAAPGLHVIRLDQAEELLAAHPDHPLSTGVAAGNLAYVFYTSGSTGRPKGVMMAHREVVQFADGLPGTMPIGPGDRVAQASNASFDAAVFEIWGALIHGATLVGIDRDVLLSAPLLGQALREQGITHLYQTAALFNQHVREQVDVYASLRQLVFGAEAVGTESVRRMLRSGKPARVLHEYGPTEATVWCTLEEVDEVAEDAPTVLIGGPIPNARAYVLDPAGEPLPVGVPGDLCIGGDGVVRGYLGRPGLTAERFVPDPFAAEPGARMYRTGDRARWRAEGKLEFMGRLDDQVKIRGFRIEPGEVEAAIAPYPGVRQARVMMREDQPGDKRLVAYVVGDAEVEALRAHLRQSLPEYMVPQAIVPLDRLPLNANGKVDRKALPAPEYASSEAYVAPRTPAEEVLAGIWAEVLGVERVGAEAGFFELGGHSLLATRVAARIRTVFGVEIPLRAVFERAVLSELAAEIERLRGTGGAAGADVIAPAAREGDLPATFAQERLWFVDALDPGSPVYSIPFSYRLTGRLDPDALRRALAELVRRHEPLRTTLPAVDGVPVQRIAPPPATFDLPVADLRHLPEGERPAEARRLAAEASAHRFDLARGPLFRASLVQVADEEHRLLLNLHHAIGDGWSLGVLLEEFSALYRAFSRGEASPPPEPALQYADYAVWQRERLTGEAVERQVEFWRRELEGAPALLELPTDRPRPPVESHRGALEHLVVSAGLAGGIHALARREGATLFMVLLAALDVVLGRLAGQEDVVIGTPIAGRTRAETDRMVGLFLNSLALRTDLSGDPSFRELLGRVRETTLSAYTHQDLPFERVLEEVRPERSLAHAPVFQVMLNLDNVEDGAFRADGLEAVGGGGGGDVASKFDLTLYVGERDGEIDFNLVYAADLFDAVRMRELLAQLEGVLRQAVAAPETRIGALALATDAARGVLPDPARPIEAEAWQGAVHETFAARAAATPDALAISAAGETWTYAELDAAANRIAHRLIDGGVRPGDVVAVYAHRSPALVRALLGAWKAGAAFAVLDPAYPPARLAAQAGAARPAALLRISAAGEVPAEVAAALAESTRLTVVLAADGNDDGLHGFPSSAPAVSVAADDLAYVAFTSGTTGTPKAIAGTDRPLAHFFGWYARELGIGTADRVSLLSGLAHDPLLRDVFAPLAVGGSIIIPDPAEIGTPGWLAGWMRDKGITVAHLTPAMAQLVASSAAAELPALRLACFGGDVLRAADVERLRAAAPNAQAVNFYGATETPQAMGWFRLPADLAKVGPAVPVGRGIDGVDLLVVTPSGTLAGIGERGEIAVRTPYLSRGYLNDAELTAARFVPNPWTGDPADRLYRTGDLGRYRLDGQVEPVGRADQQVKVRGFRVELGEVESALASHPSIREAAVLARETGEAGDRRLVGYWVPVDGSAEPDAAALRTHLKALLPEYMVPSAYVRLDRLPLTANGKLDRRALPEPESAAADARPAAPRNPTEEILAQIWAEVLRRESVGVDDDFFALGGHSLLATRLLARVQNALGVVLPLRAVFEGPTVAELAVRVEEVRRAGLPALPPVVRVDRDRPLPLSFAQERLWFIDRLEGGSAQYNMPTALRLNGALNVGALERSLGEVVRRHESLRTVFHEVDEAAVQVIAPFAGFVLPIDDLSGLHEADREAEVLRRAREDAARPFDLARGPLFRAALLRLSAEEHVLLLCIHHAVTDGWSSGVLFRELTTLYAAYREGGDSPLPELPVQYADFAVWQREQLAGEALDRQLAYWKERLAGAPALLELPADRPRPPVQSHRGARERFELPRTLLDGLQALGRGEGATLYMVLLSAFQLLLSRYSGSEDVVVGSPIAGRTTREVEELIGFFANTLVLRTDLSGDPSFRQLLARVREGTLGAYEHQEVPFERLVAELQPERSLSHAPIFQVAFVLQNTGGGGGGLPALEVGEVGADLASARFDLTLELAATTQGLRGVMEYSTDLFDRSTVQRMLGHLERVLEQVAADADVRLSRLELLGAAERARVLEAWTRTEAGVPADRCIHQLFEARAAGAPMAVAVVYEGEAVRYGELNARANQLAHYLRRRGVGPEVRVGLCLERGVEMIVSILAVLKAGGAYVPLDPAYPADRLAFTLSDAGVPVVLAQEKVRALLAVPDGVELISLEAAQAEIEAESAENPASGATPESLAYVIYTSGSTGTPKGALIEHRNVARLFSATDAWFGFGADDVWTLFHSYAFDFSVWEIWGALLYGGRLVVVPVDVSRDPEAFHALVQHEGVTVLNQTPSAFRQFIRVDGERGGDLALRNVIFGGEALEPASLREWVERRGTETPRLVNMYGITETTVHVTYRVLGREDVFGGSGSPIGRAIPDLRLYVLDPARGPVPVGVPGELYVGGAGVARGYLNRPELTAARFVDNPFGEGRLYRSGDRVRWLADGTLEYLGRLDEQVKIRGFRIELGEIEAALRQAPGVADCTVVVREDAPGDRRLVAYVVGEAEAEALRDRLRQGLPEYMVPAAFVSLDALPLTANGKLDRKALPAPEGDAYARRSYEAPLGEIETALAEIWAEVLGLDRVGRRDNFFELGGHSLLAIKLIGRMRRAGLYMEVRALFTTPVLAELAVAVGGASLEMEVPANGIAEGSESITPRMLPLVELSQEEIDRIVAGVPGGAANVQDIYPLTHLQEGFLFHHQLSEEGDPYLMSTVTEFDTRARLDQYLAALQAVIDRHDILRTSVAWEGLREPVQLVWRHAPLPVDEVQLDAEAPDAARQLWERYDPRHYRMDLRRAPLLRACIAQVPASGRWLMLMLMHHLVDDRESLEVLQGEISAHLLGLESELPAPLPFRNYVAQARSAVKREEHERFFRAMLGDVEEPTAPYGLLDVWREGHGIGEARLRVGGDVAARLRGRARALGVSAASLYHLAWAQVLARLSGRDDVVFGTVLFGRMGGGEGSDRVMGPFINTLPVRIGVGDEEAETAVRRTHALLADLLRHEHASLSLAQRSSGVAAPAPLFTSLLNYRYSGGRGRSRGAGEAGEGVRDIGVQERTNYPLTLSVNDLGDDFLVLAQVAAPGQAERVCGMMHTALERLVEALEVAPGRAIGSIDVLPEAERRMVVEAWSHTEAEYPADRCVHELFQVQAERTPRAVALVWDGGGMTYGELDARANRLAHHLRRAGVAAGARVGVCLERGPEMVVATLAALKAGGAYVPLDPSYPAERLAFMLADTAVPVLVTESSLADRLPPHAARVVRVDADAGAIAAESADALVAGTDAEAAAYVMYTSGSTGRPKGVEVSHRAVVRLVRGQDYVSIHSSDVFLQLAPASFDAATLELWGPLLNGARLAIHPPEQPSVESIGRALAEHGVTILWLTAGLFHLVVEERIEVLRGVRQLLAGGDVLSVPHVRRVLAELPETVLINGYGPTENTTFTCCHRVVQAPGEGGSIPIGRPIANTYVRVLDAGMRPAPVGVAGELYAGGAGLALGYLNRPELTAETFVADPYLPGARLYRTGDRVRWRADGTVEFLGRVDTQVKIRGFRVEPGEIEAVLRAWPGVREAAVVVREDQPGDRRLVAYVAGEVAVDEVREHLRGQLPEHMLPAAFVLLEALPLTQNGKLDRKALPAPEYAADADRYVAPRTPTEEALAQVWAEMLRLERVGVHDSFFELGGHSLLATRVVSRVREMFGVEVPLRVLFERPTVAELAGHVDAALEAMDAELAQVDPEEMAQMLALLRESSIA